MSFSNILRFRMVVLSSGKYIFVLHRNKRKLYGTEELPNKLYYICRISQPVNLHASASDASYPDMTR